MQFLGSSRPVNIIAILIIHVLFLIPVHLLSTIVSGSYSFSRPNSNFLLAIAEGLPNT